MNKYLCPPFKGATPQSITQGFIPKQHEATDFAGKYGTWLVAPFNCKITRIKCTVDFEKNTHYEMEQGFGVLMTSIENPNMRVMYWHCLGFFPVIEGDIVLQGQIVGQLGNSGYIMSNGKYVPIDDRTKFPFFGSHLHLSMGIGDKNVNFLDYVDWKRESNYGIIDVIKSISNITLKMIGFIKK